MAGYCIDVAPVEFPTGINDLWQCWKLTSLTFPCIMIWQQLNNTTGDRYSERACSETRHVESIVYNGVY